MFRRGTQTRPAGTLTQHPVRVQSGEGADQDGCLIYLGDQLVSLLVRLQPGTAAPEHRHKWRVAETYGPGKTLARAPLFDTPDAMVDWIARRLPRPAPPAWLDAHLLP